MKKTDWQYLRKKSIKELRKVVEDKKNDLVKHNISRKTGKEKNLKKGKSIRKEIARILTIIREKEIVEQELSREKKK